MQIKIEDFAARRIINFFLPQPISESPLLMVAQSMATTDFALLKNITETDGVERCLICPSLIGVRYTENADVAQIKALVLAEIDDYFTSPQPIDTEQKTLPLIEQIEALADSFIRPTLYRDNGGIEILSAENGNVIMQFTGHCAGCPYAQNTLNNVVIKTLQKYLPQIRAVQIKE